MKGMRTQRDLFGGAGGDRGEEPPGIMTAHCTDAGRAVWFGMDVLAFSLHIGSEQ
jgi:hypothetical protein